MCNLTGCSLIPPHGLACNCFVLLFFAVCAPSLIRSDSLRSDSVNTDIAIIEDACAVFKLKTHRATNGHLWMCGAPQARSVLCFASGLSALPLVPLRLAERLYRTELYAHKL